MFPPLDDQITCARMRSMQLLEEARIERMLNAARSRRAPSRSAVHGLLIAFSNVLIKLGQQIRAACGVSPLPATADKVSELQMR